MKTLSIALITGLLTFSGTALAQDAVPEFPKADLDNNGYVDSNEFMKVKNMAEIEKGMADFDENKDGKLTKNEYDALLELDCD